MREVRGVCFLAFTFKTSEDVDDEGARLLALRSLLKAEIEVNGAGDLRVHFFPPEFTDPDQSKTLAEIFSGSRDEAVEFVGRLIKG